MALTWLDFNIERLIFCPRGEAMAARAPEHRPTTIEEPTIRAHPVG